MSRASSFFSGMSVRRRGTLYFLHNLMFCMTLARYLAFSFPSFVIISLRSITIAVLFSFAILQRIWLRPESLS